METEQSVKYINKLMIIGTVVNAFMVMTTSVGLAGEVYATIFSLIMLGFLLISIIGLFLSAFNQSKFGPILVIVGSVIFIPIGIIAILGARKVLDNIKREELLSQ